MAYYSNHNLAYDFSLFEEEQVVRPVKKVKKAEVRPSAKAEKKEKVNKAAANRSASREAGAGKSTRSPEKKKKSGWSGFSRVFLGVIAGLAVIAVIISIIHGQVQLTELNQEIIDARADLAEKQSVYTQLEMKVDSSISTSVVEKYAQENLNMNKAANSQKEFISLSDGDKAEIIVSHNKSLFEIIADALASLWS